MSEDSGISTGLFRTPPEAYGPDYRAHVLEQYKLYVEMHDRMSARRQSTNNYCVTIATALLGVIGAVVGKTELHTTGLIPLLALAGIMVSYYWRLLIKSYGDLSRGKFHVILELEGHLPVAPYDEEWKCLSAGKGRKRYHPFTRIEKRIPILFGVVFLVVLIWSLYVLISG